jgi:hypothetical protein
LRHRGLLSDWPRLFRVFCPDFTPMTPMPGKVGPPVGVRYISHWAENGVPCAPSDYATLAELAHVSRARITAIFRVFARILRR